MKIKKKKVVKKSFNKLASKSRSQKQWLATQKGFKSYFTGLWNAQFKILVAYLSFVLLGAILLIIPSATTNIASENGFNFADALFSSASAFSNTGLIVGRTSEFFTIYGQIVIYFLIQIGGFGLLSTFFLIGRTFNKFFLKGKEFKSILGHAERGQTKISSSFRILIVIFFIIFIFQLLTTFTLWPIFYLVDFSEPGVAIDNGVGFNNLGLSFWTSLFLVGSSINNAGFDLFSGASGGSLGTFFGGIGIIVQVITLSLFLFGGIGYMVIFDIWKSSTFFIYKNNPNLYRILVNAKLSEEMDSKPRISIYSKISLYGNLIIIVSSLLFAYAIIWISHNNFDGNISSTSTTKSWVSQKLGGLVLTAEGEWLDSGQKFSTHEVNFAIFFSTMSTRSAGFATFDMGHMAESTKSLFSILMMIGTSPSSTGGGIRVTTLVVLIATIWQKIRGNEYSTFLKKQIASKTKVNASITLIFAGFLIIFSTFWVTLFDPNIEFTDALFISSSAFGTTGLSTVSPESINNISFIALIPIMIVGQLGITNSLETFNVGRHKYIKTTPEEIEFRVG